MSRGTPLSQREGIKQKSVAGLKATIRSHNKIHCPTQKALNKMSMSELKQLAKKRRVSVTSTRKRKPKK